MSWAVGWEYETKRWRGYGVPAYCEEPGCPEEIDRGLAYACGGLNGCGRFFCDSHLWYRSIEEEAEHEEAEDPEEDGPESPCCKRCLDGEEPYPVKPEHPEWLKHVLTDDSWAQWRSEEPELVATYTKELEATK